MINKIMQEVYCSFEVAKLLKEKGFDEPCECAYSAGGQYLLSCYKGIADRRIKNDEASDFSYSSTAPTHQMAMKWLREVHNKHCDIGYDIDLKWFFQIIDLKETVEYDYPETKYYHTENESGFNSYEDAVEAALKYTLENLF